METKLEIILDLWYIIRKKMEEIILKTEFAFGKHIYKEVEKEEVIFYIMADYEIFVIEKEMQKEILKETKYMSDCISYGMIYNPKGERDKYGEFLDAMEHYLYDMRVKTYNDCIYYIIIGD